MDLNTYMDRFKVTTRRPATKEQLLADDIWNYFYKKLPFPRIMRMIKEKGDQAIYEVWNEVKQSDCKDPLALFIWKTKKNKTIWQK